MTSGTEQVVIRKATIAELDTIKRLADRHRHELGFIVRRAMELSITKREVFVAVVEPELLCGFVQYRHRKDTQTTLYNVVVEPAWRRRGVGRQLVDALLIESARIGKHHILLRCPTDLVANAFYPRCGFVLDRTDKGKSRPLNVWVQVLEPTNRGGGCGERSTKTRPR